FASRYSVMPSTEVTLTGGVIFAAGAEVDGRSAFWGLSAEVRPVAKAIASSQIPIVLSLMKIPFRSGNVPPRPCKKPGDSIAAPGCPRSFKLSPARQFFCPARARSESKRSYMIAPVSGALEFHEHGAIRSGDHESSGAPGVRDSRHRAGAGIR